MRGLIKQSVLINRRHQLRLDSLGRFNKSSSVVFQRHNFSGIVLVLSKGERDWSPSPSELLFVKVKRLENGVTFFLETSTQAWAQSKYIQDMYSNIEFKRTHRNDSYGFKKHKFPDQSKKKVLMGLKVWILSRYFIVFEREIWIL